MNLVIGLGNPGAEYNFTRHNFGFLALDYYAKVRGFAWQNPKFGAPYFKNNLGNTFFIKPQDYYNNSGRAVRDFVAYYKIPLQNILVICDDFDLEFGTVRFRAKGSNAGNNGLKSIEQYLKTNDFARIRIGTNNSELRHKMGDVKFVLGHFSASEKNALPSILDQVIQKINNYLGES